MGNRNSSVTRVWPVFDKLLDQDPSGDTWLVPLLKLGSRSVEASPAILRDPGRLLPELAWFDLAMPGPLVKVLGASRMERLKTIRNAYERDIPPSAAFLHWLLHNPDRLVWPRDTGGRERVFADSTNERRRRLLAGDTKVRDEALSELDCSEVEGSKRKWWAFEGFTSVDCLLETERLLVLIEGKRTEGISKSTDWFRGRNQVIRNLEVARAMAGATKEYAVLLCAEKHIELPDAAWCDSLPHFSEQDINELQRHYLGCTTWPEIVRSLCPDLQLPDTLDEAIACCLNFRK